MQKLGKKDGRLICIFQLSQFMMTLSTLNKLLFTLLFINFTLTFNAQAYNHDNLTQTQNLVKANDKYLTLLGTQVALEDQAPNFKVVDKNFLPVQLSDFKGQTVLISVVPSLDTGVCSIQTKP
jgi:thiol peroxidase